MHVLQEDQWRKDYLWNLLGKLQEDKQIAMLGEQMELQTFIDGLVWWRLSLLEQF